MKKKTRAQKNQDSPRGPKGKSKYAKKVTLRRKLALKFFGLKDLPFPVMYQPDLEE